MEKVIVKTVSIDSPEFLQDVPNILYKYRDWNNPFHRNLLQKGELFFASISGFNDPFDGTIPHRYAPEELTEDNIFKKYLEITTRKFPHLTETAIHEKCYEYQRRGYFHNEKYLEDFEKDTCERLNEQFGIACLSKKNDNILMWSHYANCHTGICLGFNKYKLFYDTEAVFKHVKYSEDLPMLSLFEDVYTYYSKLIGTKSILWDYEKEYRLSKTNFANQIAKLQKQTIEEVILGAKMDQNIKFNIIDYIKENLPHVKVYDAKISKTKFTIDTTMRIY